MSLPADGVADAGWLRRYWRKRRNWRLALPRAPQLQVIPGAHVAGYFNATLLAHEPGKMTLICRKAYYSLSTKGQMVGAAELAQTRNFSVELQWKAGRFELGDTCRLEALDGLEDIRLFQTPQHTFFFAVELVSAAQSAQQRLPSQPVTGVIKGRGTEVSVRRMHLPEPPQRVEKNWVYFLDRGRLLIEKSPGTSDLYAVDPSSLTLTRAGTPAGALFWSGTKAISWNGGTLFLDHRRVKLPEPAGIKIRYVYRFRHHSGDTVRHSREFSMGPRSSVLYVSDLQRAEDLGPQFGDGVVLSVSMNDNSFSLLQLPAARLAKLLR